MRMIWVILYPRNVNFFDFMCHWAAFKLILLSVLLCDGSDSFLSFNYFDLPFCLFYIYVNILNLRRFLPPQMLSPRFAPSKMDLGPSVFPEQHITVKKNISPNRSWIYHSTCAEWHSCYIKSCGLFHLILHQRVWWVTVNISGIPWTFFSAAQGESVIYYIKTSTICLQHSHLCHCDLTEILNETSRSRLKPLLQRVAQRNDRNLHSRRGKRATASTSLDRHALQPQERLHSSQCQGLQC